MVFDKNCRIVELPKSTCAPPGVDETVPNSANTSSYRIPQNLREAGITPGDIDNVEQLIEHNLVVGVGNFQKKTFRNAR